MRCIFIHAQSMICFRFKPEHTIILSLFNSSRFKIQIQRIMEVYFFLELMFSHWTHLNIGTSCITVDAQSMLTLCAILICDLFTRVLRDFSVISELKSCNNSKFLCSQFLLFSISLSIKTLNLYQDLDCIALCVRIKHYVLGMHV